MPARPRRPEPEPRHSDLAPSFTRGQREQEFGRPPLRLFTTTLWDYPSQHYDAWFDEQGKIHRSVSASRGPAMQGSKHYIGATPSWVIWQCLMRYTNPGDVVLDPMVGSGTTIDVCKDLGRTAMCFDLAPSRPDIRQADARRLPVPPHKADFVFIDPPYSTHIDYGDNPDCIGKLDAGGPDDGVAYYEAMDEVFAQLRRALKPGGHLALYVSDSFRKTRGKPGGTFMPIGLSLLRILIDQGFEPVDIISVVRHNQKLERGNFRKAAEEGNFFLRGFNYLFIVKETDDLPEADEETLAELQET